jgi:hypothetical protein
MWTECRSFRYDLGILVRVSAGVLSGNLPVRREYTPLAAFNLATMTANVRDFCTMLSTTCRNSGAMWKLLFDFCGMAVRIYKS